MRAARVTAGPMRIFSTVFGWLIRLLNGSANWLVRRLGVEPQEELASARSPEELGLLAAYSAKAGALPEETAVLLRRTIRFGEKRAAEAMTPAGRRRRHRRRRAGADACSTSPGRPDTAGSRCTRRRWTRSSGVVTVIDALGVPAGAPGDDRRSRAVAREPVLVPESLDLDGVLATLQTRRRGPRDRGRRVRRHRRRGDHRGPGRGAGRRDRRRARRRADACADRWPRRRGLPTVARGHRPGGARTWLVDGVLREDELAELTGFRLPEGPYETLAGFLLARLGHIPVAGETRARSTAGSSP